MTKQDVQKQMEIKKQERIFHHKEMLKMYGPASGLTKRQWSALKVKGKGSGSKGKGFANNRLWNHNDLEPIRNIKFD
tara:strand:+ start:165 stop:395 length:231 start_codon:yes stop_codon:yes gene_type:complete